jgi:hypothetical protein
VSEGLEQEHTHVETWAERGAVGGMRTPFVLFLSPVSLSRDCSFHLWLQLRRYILRHFCIRLALLVMSETDICD